MENLTNNGNIEGGEEVSSLALEEDNHVLAESLELIESCRVIHVEEERFRHLSDLNG